MSDGGAGALVEMVSLLARSRAGRVLLLVGAVYLTVQYVVSQLSRAALVGLGVLLAGLLALVIAFFLQRRKRRERASMRQWLAFAGLALIAGGAVLFLAFRRRKTSALGAPPSAEEVERLAMQQGMGR
ncbi:MAG: LPXTG cell wall anchor domain-containing protein [Polyangiaceae bacterium]